MKLPKKAKLIALGLLLSLNFACGNGKQSKVQGHYEETTEEAMEVFRGNQFAVPEYAPTESVILGMPALDLFQREDLVAAILAAGAEKVFLTTRAGSSTSINRANLQRLRNLLGSDINRVEIVNQAAAGGLTVWARDWAPIGARTLNSFSDELRLVDFNYYPRRKADDATARAMETIYSLDRVSVPVYNEGGNFMNNDVGHCMMTARVTEANRRKYRANDLILDATQIKSYYRDFTGCSKVTIFPRMPNEGTGHIDMWAKFLTNDVVLVNEMRPETINLTHEGSANRRAANAMKSYLDERATEIAADGYEVVRVPMPSPIIGGNNIVRSYSNSLIVNKTAIVPRYTRPAALSPSYADASLIAAYEAEVTAAYEAAGFEVVYIDADRLIASGGAIHCITMQLPRL